MKTIDDFYNDQCGALRTLAECMEEWGYKVRRFTNLNGNETVVVEVEDEGRPTEFVATFEEVI